MLNLITNAIKFTHKGSIRIELDLRKTEYIQMLRVGEYSDTGIGIDKDNLDSLFDSFIQADPTITREYGGTGLGLTITRSLVELMDGKIGVESEPW